MTKLSSILLREPSMYNQTIKKSKGMINGDFKVGGSRMRSEKSILKAAQAFWLAALAVTLTPCQLAQYLSFLSLSWCLIDVFVRSEYP